MWLVGSETIVAVANAVLFLNTMKQRQMENREPFMSPVPSKLDSLEKLVSGPAFASSMIIPGFQAIILPSARAASSRASPRLSGTPNSRWI
jgi:hypothetical protein